MHTQKSTRCLGRRLHGAVPAALIAIGLCVLGGAAPASAQYSNLVPPHLTELTLGVAAAPVLITDLGITIQLIERKSVGLGWSITGLANSAVLMVFSGLFGLSGANRPDGREDVIAGATFMAFGGASLVYSGISLHFRPRTSRPRSG